MTLEGYADIIQVAKKQETNTLIIDVERMKGRLDGLEFWSLNDFKKRRLPYELVTLWPRTTTASWRWFGEKKIHFDAEWNEGGAAGFAERVRDELDKADFVSGHNVTNADRKWLNSLFRDHKLRLPSPYRVIDTLQVARRELGDESLTLGALTQRYGIPTKEGRYDVEIMRAACEGVAKAQRYIQRYNMADVEASTGLLTCMLPLVRNIPHVRPLQGMIEDLCPRCGSDKIEGHGTVQPQVNVYPLYLCTTCQGWYKGTRSQGRGPAVKAL